jgi:hypothetical protein
MMETNVYYAAPLPRVSKPAALPAPVLISIMEFIASNSLSYLDMMLQNQLVQLEARFKKIPTTEIV